MGGRREGIAELPHLLSGGNCSADHKNFINHDRVGGTAGCHEIRSAREVPKSRRPWTKKSQEK